MICPSCKGENPAIAVRCHLCGASLERPEEERDNVSHEAGAPLIENNSRSHYQAASRSPRLDHRSRPNYRTVPPLLQVPEARMDQGCRY